MMVQRTKFEWDLANTELKLHVWDELEGLVAKLDSAPGVWALYVPEDRPEEVSKESLQKLKKSELVEQFLSLQKIMNEELDNAGMMVGEALYNIVEPIRNDILSLQSKAEDILNRLKRKLK